MTDRDHPHYYSKGIPADYPEHVHVPLAEAVCQQHGVFLEWSRDDNGRWRGVCGVCWPSPSAEEVAS